MADPVGIIGGDAAGVSAASKLARDDPDRSVKVCDPVLAAANVLNASVEA